MSLSVTPRDLKYICSGQCDPESKITAATALVRLDSKESAFAVRTLSGIVMNGSDSRSVHQACHEVTRLLDQSPACDLYSLLNELKGPFTQNGDLSDQKKIYQAFSSILTHILVKYHSQKGGDRQIGWMEESKKRDLITQIRGEITKKRGEIKDKGTSYPGDTVPILRELAYIECATYLLETEENKKQKYFAAFGLVVCGIMNLLNKEIGESIKNFSKAFEKFDKRAPKWFGSVFALKMLERTKARETLEGAQALIKLIDEQAKQHKTCEVIYQGLISLGNVAVYGSGIQIRQLAYTQLVEYLPRLSSDVSLKMQVLRSLSKVAKEGHLESSERAQARRQILQMWQSEPEASPFRAACGRKLQGATDYGQAWYSGEGAFSKKVEQKVIDFTTYSNVAKSVLGIKDQDVDYPSSSSPGSSSSIESGSSSEATKVIKGFEFRDSNTDSRLVTCLGVPLQRVERLFPQTEGLVKWASSAGVRFEAKGVERLINELAKGENRDITTLDMRDCPFAQEDFVLFLQGLSQTAVTKVLFSRKLKEDEEGEVFAKAIQSNNKKDGFTFEFEDPTTNGIVGFALRKYNHDKAEAYLNKAIATGQSDPNLDDFHLRRAIIRRSKGDFENALEDIQVLIKSTDLVYRGKGYLQWGFLSEDREKDYKLAEIYYRKGLEVGSKNGADVPRLKTHIADAIYKTTNFKDIDDPAFERIKEGYRLSKEAAKHSEKKPFCDTVLRRFTDIMNQLHPDGKWER